MFGGGFYRGGHYEGGYWGRTGAPVAAGTGGGGAGALYDYLTDTGGDRRKRLERPNRLLLLLAAAANEGTKDG